MPPEKVEDWSYQRRIAAVVEYLHTHRGGRTLSDILDTVCSTENWTMTEWDTFFNPLYDLCACGDVVKGEVNNRAVYNLTANGWLKHTRRQQLANAE
jgi:hypothetical protein